MTVEANQPVTTAHVRKHVSDWLARIEALYADIKNWLPGGYVAETEHTVRMYEELMQRFGIPARELPVLTIHNTRGAIDLTFKPYGLWIIGGNGRIDIFGADITAFLVDRAERFEIPKWELYSPNQRRLVGRSITSGREFSREAFRQLLTNA
jgi:hypothetical protein